MSQTSGDAALATSDAADAALATSDEEDAALATSGAAEGRGRFPAPLPSLRFAGLFCSQKAMASATGKTAPSRDATLVGLLSAAANAAAIA